MDESKIVPNRQVFIYIFSRENEKKVDNTVPW